MREILFRAKRVDNGEWVEGFCTQLPKPSLGATIITNGDLCAEDVSDYIIVNESKQHSNFSNAYPIEVVECEYYEIDSETLCQYTGLKDKNGDRIWENDIVEDKRFNEFYKIVFRVRDGGWYVENIKSGALFRIMERTSYQYERCGNIFDNPELLKGGITCRN